jgi:hypothetical protein
VDHVVAQRLHLPPPTAAVRPRQAAPHAAAPATHRRSVRAPRAGLGAGPCRRRTSSVPSLMIGWMSRPASLMESSNRSSVPSGRPEAGSLPPPRLPASCHAPCRGVLLCHPAPPAPETSADRARAPPPAFSPAPRPRCCAAPATAPPSCSSSCGAAPTFADVRLFASPAPARAACAACVTAACLAAVCSSAGTRAPSCPTPAPCREPRSSSRPASGSDAPTGESESRARRGPCRSPPSGLMVRPGAVQVNGSREWRDARGSSEPGST